MLELPFSYDQINAQVGQVPQSFIHVHGTSVSRFFKRYLLQDALAVFDWTLPTHWDPDFFRYVLMGFGHVAVFRTDKYGIIPQYAHLYGYNVFYRPRMALVSNPLLESREMEINKDCTIIKLCPDYGSIADLVDYYGDLMALTYESLAINILNSRLAYLIAVDTKTEADTYKALYDQIASGQPAVVYRGKQSKPDLGTIKDSSKQWQTLVQNLQQSFIAPDLLDSLQNIRDEFLTHIGIPNISDRKKERVNLVDSERNAAETAAKVQLWLDELHEGIDNTIKHFPELRGQLSVRLRFPDDTDMEGDNDNGKDVRNRTL